MEEQEVSPVRFRLDALWSLFVGLNQEAERSKSKRRQRLFDALVDQVLDEIKVLSRKV